MTVGLYTPKQLSKWLLEENKKGRSWRVIARQDFNPKIVKPGTLSRIAKHKGKWIPKRKDIQLELGVIEVKRIFDMSPKELLWRLNNRETF